MFRYRSIAVMVFCLLVAGHQSHAQGALWEPPRMPQPQAQRQQVAQIQPVDPLAVVPAQADNQGEIRFLQSNISLTATGEPEIDYAAPARRHDIPVNVEAVASGNEGIDLIEANPADGSRAAGKKELKKKKEKIGTIETVTKVKDSKGKEVASVEQPKIDLRANSTVKGKKNGASGLQTGLLLLTSVIMISTGLTLSLASEKKITRI